MSKARKNGKNDLSRKRRRKKTGKLFFAIIFFLLVGGAGVFAMRAKPLQIKDVVVSDTSKVDKDKIEEVIRANMAGTYLGIIPKSNFLLYPKDKIVKGVMELSPSIIEAKPSMSLDLILSIKVKERLSAALWCEKEDICYFMDMSGVVFAPANYNEQKDTPFIRYYGDLDSKNSPKQYGAEGFFPKLSYFVAKLKDLGFEVEQVEVDSVEKIQIHLDIGSFIMILPESIENDEKSVALFTDIELLLNDMKSKNGGVLPAFEYIDARYGNKIFYKLKSV